jgi:hypothetical protein
MLDVLMLRFMAPLKLTEQFELSFTADLLNIKAFCIKTFCEDKRIIKRCEAETMKKTVKFVNKIKEREWRSLN